MTFSFKKRNLVRVTSFFLAGVLALAGGVIQSRHRLKMTTRQLSHRYQAALEELTSGIDNIAVTLEKSMYAGTSGGMCGLTGELELQAGAVETAISALPLDQEGIGAVSKFVSQVSDFASVLLRKAVNGSDITTEERKSLSSLAETAKTLSTRLDEALSTYNSADNWQRGINDALAGVKTEEELSASVEEMAKQLSDSPTLIYDGPFSDHIEERSSQMLASAEEINEEQAKNIAAEYCGVSAEELEFTSEEHGKMPSYHFGNDNISISVTKRGGFVSYFRKDRDINGSSVKYEQALIKAKTFLENKNLKEFSPTYYYTEENMCVINFAYTQNGVICYPDLIKVGVALDDSEILFYEARGYIMNHSARTLSTPLYTEQQAAAVLSPRLKYKSVNKAIIPSGGQNELYCYEFLCEGLKGEEVLVYVNTQSLYEENILILLKTDGGTLTK